MRLGISNRGKLGWLGRLRVGCRRLRRRRGVYKGLRSGSCWSWTQRISSNSSRRDFRRLAIWLVSVSRKG